MERGIAGPEIEIGNDENPVCIRAVGRVRRPVDEIGRDFRVVGSFGFSRKNHLKVPVR